MTRCIICLLGSEQRLVLEVPDTCQQGLDSALVPLTKSFLTYTAGDEAQGKLTSTGYVPISGDLLTKVRKAVASIA